MAEVTEADREKAAELQMAQWGIAFDDWTDRIAAALAEEREKAREPFLALIDSYRTQRAAEED